MEKKKRVSRTKRRVGLNTEGPTAKGQHHSQQHGACLPREDPTVPEGHEHRVTAPENPRNILHTPAEPRRDPAERSQRPPQSPLRGKSPRRASRRVVPLGW